ncbi:MAG: glycosyltransferase, partial [Solobacterium sp.]|nr:glycosyltransferase [Solobacterium sp.]
ADSRIRVFHTANQGVDAARNLGMEQAGCDWLMFLDSDDMLEEHAMEVMHAHAAGADAVIAGYSEIPGGKKYQAVRAPQRISRLNESAEQYISLDRSFVLNCLHAKLYRKEALRCRFREGQIYADDTFFNMDNLFAMQGIVFLPDYLYLYRRRSDPAALHNRAGACRLAASHALMRQVLSCFPGCAAMKNYLTGKYVIRLYNHFFRRLRDKENEAEKRNAAAEQLQRPMLNDPIVCEARAPLPELDSFLSALQAAEAQKLIDIMSEPGRTAIRSDSPGMISVILPVYNMEDTLGRAVDSILAQTYQHWELLLIDDGSTDNIGAAVDMYAAKDARIHAFHQTNGGTGAARNTGLSHAHGEWIAFLDGDDIYLPESFGQMIGQSEGADLVACGTYIHHAGMYCRPYSEVRSFPGLPDGEDLDTLWANCIYPVVWAKLYRRSRIREMFVTDLNYGEDTLFNFRVLPALGKIVIIPQIGYHYIRKRERLDRGMLEGARRQLETAAQLFPADSVILRRTYIAFVRQARRFALNVIDSNTMIAAEKAEEFAFCGRMSQLPEDLDHEEYLFPVNLVWWRQLKAGAYEQAAAGLRIILKERERKRNVLYKDGGSADPGR